MKTDKTKYYMCYLSCERAPKNNLEKDMLKALRDRDREIIEFEEVNKLEHELKIVVDRLNKNNSRSKPLEISLWKPRNDYFLQGVDCAIFLLLECEIK